MTTNKRSVTKSRAPTAKARRPLKPKQIAGTAALARDLEVSRVTVDAWIGRGMPILEKNRAPKPHVFDLAAVKDWLAKQGLQQETNLDAPRTRAEADLALVMQKIRGARARADRDELTLKARRGELLDAVEVERGRVGRIGAVKSMMFALPAAIAPELVGRDLRAIQARLEQWAREACETFARVT